jgi:hypothetical protein
MYFCFSYEMGLCTKYASQESRTLAYQQVIDPKNMFLKCSLEQKI